MLWYVLLSHGHGAQKEQSTQKYTAEWFLDYTSLHISIYSMQATVYCTMAQSIYFVDPLSLNYEHLDYNIMDLLDM